MKKIINLFACFVILTACNKENTAQVVTETPINYYKGADVSWLTEMEDAGIKFYNANNQPKECIGLLKDNGVNAIRLRVWVNPSSGWNNLNDVLNKAKRAKQAGLALMIDFHYSDNWADPGQQTKPAAWQTLNFTALNSAVANHTTLVLNTLKSNGIVPKWVQMGNETNDGMLWPDGKASTNMANFATLVTTSYNAIKSVDTSIKAVLHLSNAQDSSLYSWMLGGLAIYNTPYDVIGMSLYPSVSNWSTFIDKSIVNINNCIRKYNKPVVLAEVGMSWDEYVACKQFLTTLMQQTKAIPNNMVQGVFYWEPQAYNNWKGYTLGAFDNTGKATPALDAFR